MDEDSPLPHQVSPFQRTSEDTLEKLFDSIEINKNDIVLDLGCGDGKIVLFTAKRFGIHSIGVDIHDGLLSKARNMSIDQKLDHLTHFYFKSFLDEDFDCTFSLSDQVFLHPTIITMYLVPEAMVLVEPKVIDYLVRCRKENRSVKVMTVFWNLKNWTPVWKGMNMYIYDSTSVK